MIKLRKVVSVLGSTVMVGSTVALAAAASYPAPFVQNGNADVAVVYGSGTGADLDLASVVDITSDLNAELASQSTGTTTTPSSGGEFVRLDKSSDHVNFGNTLSGVFGTNVDDEDMDELLADGSYTADDSDTFDYEQKITLGSPALAHFRDSDYEQQAGLDDRTPTVGFNISNDAFILNYTLDFLDDAESDIVSSDLDDIEGSDIVLFGNTYYVSDFKNGTNANTFGVVTLLDSANQAIISEGETSTISVNGKTYEVSITFIDSDEVRLNVNGQTTNKLTAGQTEKLSDGAYLGIREVSKLEVAGETGNVEISIGSGKLELTSGSDIELNDEAVNGVKSYVMRGTASGAVQKIDKIVIEWKTDDEAFITNDLDLVIPGFESLKFSMNDLVRNDEEMITVQNDGDDSVELRVPIKDGETSINLLYANSTGEFTGIGKASDERLATSQTSELVFREKYGNNNYHEQFVASYNTTTDSESYVLSFDVNEDTSDGRNETTVRNEVTGDSWSERTAGDVFDLGDVSFTINDIGKNSTDEWVNITAGTNVNFNTIFSAGGLKIYLPFEANGSTVNGGIDFDDAQIGHSTGHDLNTWYLFMDGENKDDDVAGGTEFKLTINDNSDGELEVSEIDASGTGGPNGKEVGSTKTYETYIVDDVAPRILHYTNGDQDYAEVYYPEGDSETYAEVFLSATDVTVSGSGSELGSVSVTDAEVSSVSGKNLIVVGGSCVNSLSASLLGLSPQTCGADWEAATGVGSGSFLIETFDRGNGKVATLVAGYNAGDTSNAATALTTQSVMTDSGMKYTGTSAGSIEAA